MNRRGGGGEEVGGGHCISIKLLHLHHCHERRLILEFWTSRHCSKSKMMISLLVLQVLQQVAWNLLKSVQGRKLRSNDCWMMMNLGTFQ